MALDVHLTRDVNEKWGFELFGGADDEMPLTIQKLQPSSPASRAGLQNGDTILTINNEEAIDFTHEEASRRIAECRDTLNIGVMRGLYDPVLDDQEPIYYEPGDLDPESQPTEVPFKVQRFLEPADLGSSLIDYGDSNDPLGTPFDPSVLLPEARSLTASPYVNPTKTYRPFSTEPVPEVPALEDPIILNPDYKDQFGESPVDINPDYILNAHCKNENLEAKYKLPISEQYDPDGTRTVKNTEVDSILSKYVNMEMLSKKTVTVDEKIMKSSRKDVKITEKSSKDVRVDEGVTKDSKTTVVKDVISKESRTKDVKETKDVEKEIMEELCSKESTKREDAKIEQCETVTEDREEEMIKEELKYIEKMKEEIDIAQIEETAVSVVEDSIERAVSVAEEIKKEMEEELTSEIKEERVRLDKSEMETEEKTEFTESKSKKVAKDIDSDVVDRRFSREEHIEDVEEKTVRKDIKVEDEEISREFGRKGSKAAFESKSFVSKQYEEQVIKETPSRKQSFAQEGKHAESTFENKGEFKKVTKTVTSGTKSDKTGAQQRLYSIGLQTIPNIRGVVQSSYHYDLLLRTFFIHLTDVMVALSRFVLTQPVFNTETLETCVESQIQMQESGVKVKKSEQELVESMKKREQQKVDESKKVVAKAEKVVEKREVVKPMVVQEKRQEIKAVSQKTEKDIKVEEKKIERRQLVTPVPVEMKVESQEKIQKAQVKQEIRTESKDAKKIENAEVKQEQKKEETITVAKVEEKKTVSGAEMAQRTEKNLTKEMTQKLDAVISEFQTIAVEEDKKEIFQRSRRSRSRSQIEEEVARESDPLEWLAKVDSRRASQEISEERLSKKEYSSSETIEKKQFEKVEMQEIKHKKTKTPKQMYRAIVEAHVYTNKDVIFEDAAEFSETSSVQSAEEINTAFEAIETMSTENVALESAVQQIEQAKIVEESQELLTAHAQSEATIQQIEEVTHESTKIKQEELKSETAIQSTDIQEVIIQESKEIIEPVVEIKESIKKESVAVDINESLSVAESSEISILESKSEFSSVEIKKESAAIVEEENKESAVVESKAEVLESTEKLEVEKAVEAQVQIEDVTENVVVKTEKPTYKKDEEFAALKIVKEVETEVDTSDEIVEVEEAVVKKIEINKELDLTLAQSVSSSEVLIGTPDVTEETETKLSSSKKIDVSSESTHVESTTIESHKSESHVSEEIVQESSFTARSVDKKLTVRTDLQTQDSIQSAPSTIDTPTPSTVPPTPLTDEYVFKLSIPLPKSRSATPVPRDCSLSPKDEDPHIVKKKLIPHIETAIEEKIIYDPPLPTPPGNKIQSPIFKTPGLFGGASKPIYKIKFPPVYRKPGLFGGADNPEYSQEEIREIERKSSLLASAIDETIKSIEEYKEEVGMEKKKEVKVTEYKEEKVSKSFSKEVVIESKQNGVEVSNFTAIEEIIENTDRVNNNGTDDSYVKIIEVAKEEVETKGAEKEADKEVNVEETVIEVSKEDMNVELSKEEESKEIVERIVEKQSIETKLPEKVEVQLDSKVETGTVEEKTEVQEAKVETESTKYEKSETTENEKAEAVIIEVEESAKKEPETSVEIEDVSETAVQTTIKTSEVKEETEKKDPMLGFRPVVFDPNSIPMRETPSVVIQLPSTQEGRQSPYITESGEIMGTIQGIVDGLEEPVMDPEVAKELGRPGISEEKIAELISGEAEMLREAHVMGLSRVLTSHMHRADDSSVDFQKIKPMIDSLKDSEVLKVLNEDLARQKEEQKKKEEKKWTTFLQKPKRPVPKAKYGYHGWTQAEQALVLEPYKVKIVKQAKPKVAPDYKPEDFETGPLPWEQRAEIEASLPPVDPEEPILIPEVPEYLEAVDPTKESEVPDLEDTGLPLPPPKEPSPPPVIELTQEEQPVTIQEPATEEVEQVVQEENKEAEEDMENRLAEQLVKNVQNMVDPNATVEQQLMQMRAQLAALAQLPEVIQQTLELVSKQLSQMSNKEAQISMSASQQESHSYQAIEVTQNHVGDSIQEGVVTESGDASAAQNQERKVTIEEIEDKTQTGGQTQEKMELQVQQENRRVLQTPLMMEHENVRVQTPQMTEEDIKMEKMKKAQQHQARMDSEARQIKQHPTPRVGKPKRMFGPLDPDSRPVVLPGGRRWRTTNDVYNEQKIAEMLQAQSELIQGKAMGFESALLPFDDRINFMKYEKPPVSLDHLQHSETYKMVHDMDQKPLKRVELLTPVIAEADYRERCRSMTPSGDKKHLQIPQQFHP